MNAPVRGPTAHHAVELGAAQGIGSGRQPAILQLEGEDFIPQMLEQLRSSEGRTALRAQLAATRNTSVKGAHKPLKLFQPVQRRFHLALVDLWCAQPGSPRVDPKRIDSAGLVLRRIRFRADGSEYREGWMRLGKTLLGWAPIDRIGDEDVAHGADAADPDPARRLAKKATGSLSLDRALTPVYAARDGALLSEDFSSLHAAPPDVCSEAGRSTYYGLVPTVSAEQTPEDPATVLAQFGPNDPDFRLHLVQPLRGEAWDLPLPGAQLNFSWYAAITNPESGPPLGVSQDDWDDATGNEPGLNNLRRLLLLLRQLDAEFDAFSSKGKAVIAELDKTLLTLPLDENDNQPDPMPAGQFVQRAYAIVFSPASNPSSDSLTLPLHWPALSAAAIASLHGALKAALLQRFSSLKLSRGRFDIADDQYRLRVFVRLKPEGNCPAKTLWSDYSEAFTIARWFEGTGAAPTRIELPSVSALSALKPNVSFIVPPSMQALLNGSAKDLSDGKGQQGPDVGLGWICSFSLPSITICAFIVLNIFLSLFDLIFSWLAFIKICIPYPKPK